MGAKKQQYLFSYGHGGSRKGAGAKKKKPGMQNHLPRPQFKSSWPLHINVKMVKEIPNLRTKHRFKLIKRAILKAREKKLRIIHFCVQSNHLHLLVEASDKAELGKSMQSFCTSLAKLINNSCRRRGRVFVDRYHLHILRTSQEVKNAMKNIFQKLYKHTKGKKQLDYYSSIFCFDLADLSKLNLNQLKWKIIKTKKYNNFYYKCLCKTFEELIVNAQSWIGCYGWRKSRI